MTALASHAAGASLTRFNERLDARAKYAVAIPAKDEEDRIGSCLRAIAGQTGIDSTALRAVVSLNNTTDRSLERIGEVAARSGISIDVIEVELPPHQANAGYARKLAMDHAAMQLADDGILLATDADTCPEPDWVAENATAIALGVDAVAGYVTAQPEELALIDNAVLALGALEWEYQHLLAEIDAKADPIPYDPWPKHNQNCGASMGLQARIYRQIGGLPPLPVGEDRALFDEIRKIDGRIRHSLAAHVITSARTVGRATGGMADALRTRGTDIYFCDEILEPAANGFRRAQWRFGARQAFAAGMISSWLAQHQPSIDAAPLVELETFGAFWAQLEKQSVELQWTLLKSDQLEDEINRARKFIAESIPASTA